MQSLFCSAPVDEDCRVKRNNLHYFRKSNLNIIIILIHAILALNQRPSMMTAFGIATNAITTYVQNAVNDRYIDFMINDFRTN